MKTHHIIALIPARSGSIGIKDKSIQEINGHPLLAYSIAAAQQSKKIDRIIVSTDSPYYAEIARFYGAEVPFLRPKRLATQSSRDFDFIKHAIDFLKQNGQKFPDFIVQLRPTSPLRPVGLIDKSIAHFLKHPQADSLRSIVESSQTPYKMWLKDRSVLKPIIQDRSIFEAYNSPRQELPRTYYQAGSVDIIKTKTVLKGTISGKKIAFFEIEKSDYCDIDNKDDLMKAEFLLKQKKYITPTEDFSKFRRESAT